MMSMSGRRVLLYPNRDNELYAFDFCALAHKYALVELEGRLAWIACPPEL